jgi:EAL domain-containing protein (putative c-di-GMP-specific phosphodiesterase class I)
MAQYESASAVLDRAGLERAIQNDELFLLYQPKISLPLGTLVGVEALVRWRHHFLGVLPPDQFIHLAEASGLINPLTQWVVTEALRQWSTWKNHDLWLNVAVNISAKNLESIEFPDLLHALCVKHQVPDECLMIELTESATQGLVELLDTLTRLRLKGIRLAIDDFGIGYSSLARLQQLPFSEMKIDRSFVMRADASKDCLAICKTIIDLAHNLGIEVVAEGVESGRVLQILSDLGCDAAQGYYIARPMEGEHLLSWQFTTTIPEPGHARIA